MAESDGMAVVTSIFFSLNAPTDFRYNFNLWHPHITIYTFNTIFFTFNVVRFNNQDILWLAIIFSYSSIIVWFTIDTVRKVGAGVNESW